MIKHYISKYVEWSERIVTSGNVGHSEIKVSQMRIGNMKVKCFNSI